MPGRSAQFVNLALLVLELASYSAMGSGPTSNGHRVYVKYVTARYILLVATRKPCLVQALSRSLIHVLVVRCVSS